MDTSVKRVTITITADFDAMLSDEEIIYIVGTAEVQILEPADMNGDEYGDVTSNVKTSTDIRLV